MLTIVDRRVDVCCVGRREIDVIVNRLLLTKGSLSSGEVARAAGLTRQAIHRYLRDMVSSGQLVQEGKGRSARYRPRKIAFNAHLRREGLAEDRVWNEVRAAIPSLGEFENAANALAHGFTEMLNNAIDHSASPTIDVDFQVDVDADAARFTVTDHGVGVFENVRAKLGLDSGIAALQEISKGKVSTQPERHSGEGIFFTSKMARTFELEANGLLWVVDNVREDHTISEVPARAGTTVRFEIGLRNAIALEALYARYVHDFEFDTSRIVVKLFKHGVRFVSRSEAKRLLVGLEKFREVILDFAGVEGVGQGFADEVFRVWAGQHPSTKLSSEHAAPPIAFMVERARRSASAK
jgi:anti-sigma regulatory factor (Ser/Thr protein kinase)